MFCGQGGGGGGGHEKLSLNDFGSILSILYFDPPIT